MATREEILNMCKAHFNEPVLVIFEVGRLVGFGEDEHDYYLLIRYPNGKSKDIVWHSASAGYTFLDRLKGQNKIEAGKYEQGWDDFSRLDHFLSLNGAHREERFLEKKYESESSP